MRFLGAVVLILTANIVALATPSKAVYSIATNANWTNGMHWSYSSGGIPCACTPDVHNDTIHVETPTVSPSGLFFGPFVLVFVRSGVTFSIKGTTAFTNGSILKVEKGGALIINGNLDNKNYSNQIIINGALQVIGNYTGGSGSAIVGTGSFSSTGYAITDGTGSVFGSTTDCQTGPCYSNSLNPFPIDLVSFKAVLSNLEKGKVLISWTTANETNNSYFTLERSFDSFCFEPAATIKGTGNKASACTYNFTDTISFDTPQYYRLKQTGFDGKYSYSQLVTVESGRNRNNK